MQGPLIYNIFPLLAGKCSEWVSWASHARSMGFDWIYLNPIQMPGFSGSLYSVKEHYRVNPLFLNEETATGYEEIELVFREITQSGVKIALDLVINHTAIDSPLTKSHPEWFKRDEEGALEHPSAIDPADARNVTVWGDLYEIDNIESADLSGLYDYWEEYVRFLVRLGVSGFRCDAAYKVPAALWERLIDAARDEAGEPVMFFAETLGCRLEEVASLKSAGFHYLYNSSRYWNYDAPWALEQHASFQEIAPSIGFPESHDTERLSVSCDRHLHVMKQRYAFVAAFSAGLQTTMGMEYGWEKACNVVTSRTSDQEPTRLDLVPFVTRVNALLTRIPLLRQEGHLEALTPFDRETLILRKSDDEEREVYIIINKNWDEPQGVRLDFPMHIIRPFHEDESETLCHDYLELQPAEVVYGRRE